MGMPSQLRGQQHRVQRGLPGRQDVDAFVEIPVSGRRADRVVRGQLRHSGVVQKPPQHQDRLFEAAQGTPVAAGTASGPFGVEQAGQEQHRLLAYGQQRGVCDTRGHAEPL